MFFKTVLGTLLLAGASVFGFQAYSHMSFDWDSATPAERTAYLDGRADSMLGSFKPNFISQPVAGKRSGNGIQLTYNTGMGSLTCGNKVDCKKQQCGRYLHSAMSRNNLKVNLVYTDNSGRRIGNQALTNRTCKRYAR